MFLDIADVSTDRFPYTSEDWKNDIQQIQAMGV